MEYLLEILKLVEASIRTDRRKAIAYAEQLADKLERGGEVRSAEKIRRSISSASAATVVPAALSGTDLVPVDSESRLSLADEQVIDTGDVALFLPERAMATVNEFVRYVAAADRLIEDGIGISPSLLMYGPPGCGKTELARYISAQLHLPLLTARTDSLISSYLGSTAKNLRLLFDHAASRPCVLFLDEFDAIAKLRDDQHELGELKRVVVSLLQNIDAVHGNTVLLAATNHDHLLDSAVWRRFAYHLQIGHPDAISRCSLFQKYLGHDFPGKSMARFTDASDGLTGSDIRQICEAVRREAVVTSTDIVAEPAVLRRILERIVGNDSLAVPELIFQAKTRLPRVFTHRVLADAFGMSPGNITYLLKKHGGKEDSNA
ncbi:MAG TPA: AAA family ATPase [Armatimonadota bacterium]|jgi:SpoVK/Ycf46/Vps4 family AAA+-type ATPase